MSVAFRTPLPRQLHPARESLYHELHARPFPVIGSPVRISHLALLLDESDREMDFQHLCALCTRYGVNPPAAHDNSFYQRLGDLDVRWERHLEFVTYTFIRPGRNESPFSQTALSLLPQDWLEAVPGQLVAAQHLEVRSPDDELLDREKLAACFEGQRLVSGRLMEGAATLWSAFRLHGDGCGRILLHNHGLNDNQTGRLILRVLELETYRLMALLGARPARDLAPLLRQLDQQLAEIIAELSSTEGLEEERKLLQQLTRMAAQIERHRADTISRFSATQAYYQLVMKRLEELKERQSGPNFTLSAFFSRRLTPAASTCDSVSQRLEDLARRIERAGDLIRTRVDLKLEEQNRRLLASMNRRSRLQLRMQETVEGLSIAAISYYGISLLRYLFGALEPLGVPLNKDIATAVAVPLVVGTVWWVTHRIKKFIVEASDPERENPR
ncbi:MAG: DUF3422 domain-containing protein [Marinospirillum sp.]|uniref:DUF3422 family protein n=1 Tax=Marinospirillum sp. TaxID=2183934 RepID=UPI0019DB5E0E|nr:DUF3422 domain-containing protein [Marinospirillum sp.]MBE0505538.1 DUF3422 domain-containing protein [Marinospirillum sp.]